MEQDKKTLAELYEFICKSENIPHLPLKFKRVGKGGACLTFCQSKRTGQKIPLCIEVDLGRICCGAAWALCHEVAHQIQIHKSNNSYHNAAFKKEEARLVNKYTRCKIANRLIF